MKITQIELFSVPPRWLFMKISTDEGLCGWAEPLVEGHTATAVAAIEDIKEFLIGADPDPIQDIWQMLYRSRSYRGGPTLMSAIAGVDQALWDIKGKRFGVPVYRLLGGPIRQRVQVYSWIGGDTPEKIAQDARAKQAQGFKAIKMNASDQMHYIETFAAVEAVIARISAIREAAGPEFGIGVDFHGRIHKGMAKVLAHELEPFHIMFIEEPVLPEHGEALRDIANHTSIPIATGERLFSRWDFKRLIHEGYVDIIQPDLSHAGGITEVYKIAAMAEAYDIALAPHCPLGPIALAACFQIDAVAHNAFIQEQVVGIDQPDNNSGLAYLNNPHIFSYEDGYITLSNEPGLGISINEEAVREAAVTGHNWRNPVWRQTDFSIAEW